jgi:hypothetical protein
VVFVEVIFDKVSNPHICCSPKKDGGLSWIESLCACSSRTFPFLKIQFWRLENVRQLRRIAITFRIKVIFYTLIFHIVSVSIVIKANVTFTLNLKLEWNKNRQMKISHSSLKLPKYVFVYRRNIFKFGFVIYCVTKTDSKKDLSSSSWHSQTLETRKKKRKNKIYRKAMPKVR